MALAARGAEVVAIDLSSTLVEHARERANAAGISGIDFRAGDMLDPALGMFDHVLAMDSIIHYELPEMLAVLTALAPRVRDRMLVTVAPRTPMLTVMRAVGRLFPRADRAPSIVPVADDAFRRAVAASPVLSTWTIADTDLVASGFYRSRAIWLQHRARG
jgi:magnesium-protoporphyrin O-methyltransferase